MNFKMKQKAFFIMFKGRYLVRNCLRPDNRPLTLFRMGFFGAAHGWGGGGGLFAPPPPSLKSEEDPKNA